MKLQNIGIALGASLFAVSLSSGIAYSAPGDGSPGAGSVSGDAPELNSAQQRVDMSKGKLDQARQQLSAAKAMLKAAEAEHKAARADQEALSLRSQARKLADASGLQETVSTGQRLYPVTMPPGGTPVNGAPNPGLSVTGSAQTMTPADVVTPVSVDTPDYTGQGSTSVAPAAGSLGAPTPNQ